MTEITVSEICAILDKCHENGVSEFEFGSLRVKFGSSQPSSVIPSDIGSEEPDPELEKKSILEQEANIIDETLANLQQEDPGLFEQLVASGDLVDDKRIRRSDDEVPGGGGS
jgi:hypothetical protein